MITSASNSKIKYVRRLQADRRFREKERHCVVEGGRLLADLLQAGVAPSLLLVTPDWLAAPENQQLAANMDVRPEVVNDRLMQTVSDMETAPGVLAVAPIQPRPLPDEKELLLILDGVANPGNLGTILRAAAAAGVDGALLAPGCVDAYNPKVIRGGMGAHWRLPVTPADWPAIAAAVQGLAVWLAAADGEISYTAVNWRRPSALIIGSEAGGAGDQARRLAYKRAYIPMHAATESLNAAVAAGVILFEALRQRLET